HSPITDKAGKITEEFLRYSQLKFNNNKKKANEIRREIMTLYDENLRKKYNLNLQIKDSYKSFLKGTFFTFFTLFTVIGCVLLLLVINIIKDTPPIDPNNMSTLLTENSIIYDSNGEETEQIQGENSRFLIDNIDDVPQDLINAFLAIEDIEFYNHNGINLKRIFGALVANVKSGGKTQGASTITQQLVKNLYLTNEKTYTRKIKEMYYSFIVENKLEKDDILVAYLNTAYLGQGAIGVQAASHIYFDKDISELTLAESALLAGITKYPSKFAAYKTLPVTLDENWDEIQLLLIAQDYVPTDTDNEIYKILLEKELIDNLTYDALIKGRKRAYKAEFNDKSKERQELVLKRMFEEGFINESQYNEAKSEEIVIKLGSSKNATMSSYFNTLVKQDVITALVDNGYTKDEAERMLYTGGLRIYSTIDPKIQSTLEKEYNNDSNFPGTFKDSNGNLQPQSASVVIENTTGEIKGMIGGRGIGGESIYNRAVNPRQPGSAIKPLAVYLPAIENKGLSASSIVKDEPIVRDGKAWPKNANGKYKGSMTLAEAVKWSSNAAVVRTTSTFGKTERESMAIVVKALENIGITTVVKREDSPSHHDELYPTVLGGMTKGVSPLEMTAAYACIANGGIYIEPITFSKIELADGTLLLQNTPEKKRVYDESTAYYMTQMLTGVVEGGTGSRAKLKNMPAAGKTGTTSNKYDAWFCGYTPYYTCSTWIGVDTPRQMSNGSAMAASLWQKIMQQTHTGLKKKEFSTPKGLVSVTICSETGLLSSEVCKKAGLSNKISVTKEKAPKQYCSESHETKNGDSEKTPITDNNNNNNINNNKKNNNNNNSNK
ncbi:MAG: transglycosylase domain-containing protein, partial [Romboutsia sp.]|nr:transglycosylase domain-containing protein [Romboutsia sp.]